MLASKVKFVLKLRKSVVLSQNLTNFFQFFNDENKKEDERFQMQWSKSGYENFYFWTEKVSNKITLLSCYEKLNRL